MVFIFNAYFDFEKNDNIKLFEEKITEYYSFHKKIRLIIDLGNKEIGMKDLPLFKKLKIIFDDDNLGVEKLLETIVICKEGFKRTIIKKFLKIPGFKPKRPVKFLP